LEAIVERSRRSLIPGVVIAAALILVLAQALPGPDVSAQAPAGIVPESMPGGQPIIYLADKESVSFHVPPRRAPGGLRPQTAAIIVNYLSSSTMFGSPNTVTCTPWPSDARTAFDYAATLWGAELNSTVAIVIDACWGTMGANVLGGSRAHDFYRGFLNAPSAQTWYPVALANALSNLDQNNLNAEVEIAYNSTGIPWYFGTDGNPGLSQYDFVSVVLHEIAHGLGFAGSMTVSGGLGSWGFGTAYPIAYDRFTETGSGSSLITAFANGSALLATQLTSNNLYFNGIHANAANGGNRPQLYAPSVWAQGSSYAHLAESFNNTVNALMTYSLSYHESIHDPGPIAMGILEDVGWTVPTAVPPTPTPLPAPDISIRKTAILSRSFTPGDRITYTLNLANLGNLPANGVRVTDTLPASLLTPTYASNLVITSSGGANYAWTVAPLAAGASGVISIYARIDPSLPLTGTIVNTAQVSASQDRDPSNNSSTAFAGGYTVYLPLVVRNFAAPAPGLGIRGRVTVGGAAASAVSLALRFYNGAAWSTWGTATTDASGNYAFTGAPTLGAGQSYCVRYDNGLSSNTRLSFWQAPLLTSYSAGATANGGSFDVANVALTSPTGGLILPLPVTFQWGIRSATSSDSYEFHIFDYAFGSGKAWSPLLGYVGQYTLTALPAGLSYPNTFGWYVRVYGPDGGYGESYYFQTIAFTNAGVSVTEAPLARPDLDRESLPVILAP
jgi:uncharacterized repeat protein (TIGR01451 family)